MKIITTGLKIYGKTGFGKVNGENTDAWFTGFYEINNQRTYYSVRLDDPKKSSSIKFHGQRNRY